MTGRRNWSQFSIRFGLITITLFAILLALHSHFEATGEQRWLAMTQLSEIGVASFPAEDLVRYEEFTFAGTSSSGGGVVQTTGLRLVMPKVVHVAPSALSNLGRSFLGSKMFDDYGALLVYKQISKADNDFIKCIGELPNLESIHYYKNTINDSLIRRLRTEHPEITVTPLDAEAPKDTNGDPMFVKL